MGQLSVFLTNEMTEKRSLINNCGLFVSHSNFLLGICLVKVCIFVFLIPEKKLLQKAEADQE